MIGRRLTMGVTVLTASLMLGALGAAASSDRESHCVVTVLSQRPSGEFVLDEPLCFGSLAGALTRGAGLDPETFGGITGPDLFAADGNQELALSSTLGVHFDGLNGSGSSISVVGAGCTGGYWNTGLSWANRISSSWNGCYRLRHYDGPNKSGASGDTVGAGSTHNVPAAINNKTESVAYLGS